MSELKWYGEKAKERVREAAAKALMDCAMDLLGKSVELAPVDLGDLRASGNVDPTSVSALKAQGTKMTARVGFNLPYAEVQHERLDFRHPKGGQAKYLEQPAEQNADKYKRYIEASVKRSAAKD